MRSLRLILVLCAVFTLTDRVAAGGEGLKARADESPWARWQGRLTLATAAPNWKASLSEGETAGIRVSGVTLSGSYFFAADRAVPDGLRATTALIIGPRAQASAVQLGSVAFVHDRRWGVASAAASEPSELASLPYLGLGYTGLSTRTRWSFSADLGLVAQYPGNVARIGRVMGGNQTLDDLLRDLRLAPLLQMGVSYSF
jgi:hypothetical protein